ncbi:hypothetical protein [Amycolatopsis sp. La24]|uniref:hypothetical protein n=1 Tax=Amycolatopsis sp. La24 TaxID=3028304 RepID=UPI0023AF293D|nr:hypothetical protein [Amycolatopsis sp. La24]
MPNLCAHTDFANNQHALSPVLRDVVDRLRGGMLAKSATAAEVPPQRRARPRRDRPTGPPNGDD